ncbi:hypothetical protein E2C01_088002 [Portunus trituberculatus]|uniref:Uncharacterized protein n=1 Tax=Portunus trituberculatus TaxID=210409 RepID=A0A5B7JDB5_PORTR|nr:hypothetical protein [Portunus trituberculatus]
MGLICTSVASAGSQVVRAGMLVQLASCLVGVHVLFFLPFSLCSAPTSVTMPNCAVRD